MYYKNLSKYCKNNNIKFHFKNEVSSTMDEAKKIKQDNHNMIVVLAKTQKKGRGRLNNIWEGKSGNIFLTFKFLPKKNINSFFELGIIASIGIKKLINYYKIENVNFKWPNDIYINGSKVGGILIESYINCSKNFCLVGIGINFSSCPNILKYKTTYLKKYNNKILLEDFIQNLIKNIINLFDSWDNNIKVNYIDIYKKSLMYIGKEIQIHNNNIKIEGKFINLTKEGYLLIKRNNKEEIIFSGSMELLE